MGDCFFFLQHSWILSFRSRTDVVNSSHGKGERPADSGDMHVGVRIVFVMGTNPWQESDGSGVASDTEAVRREEEEWGDLLRVPSVHHAGSEGRARIIHDLWRRLPLQHDAKFYIKANVCSLSLSSHHPPVFNTRYR